MQKEYKIKMNSLC